MEIKTADDSILCRICCNSCSYNVEPVDDLTKKMLIKLLLDPDIFIDKAPVVCNNCVENIERCYYFKLSCLCTEKTINSYVTRNPDTKCDLVEVYLSNNGNKNVPDDYIVCRLCMVLVNRSFCWFLVSAIDGISTLMKVLGQYFPELDLRISNDPAICMNCLTSLQNYFEFVKYCLQRTMSDVKAERKSDASKNNNKASSGGVSESTPIYSTQLENKYDDGYIEEDYKTFGIKGEDECVAKAFDLDYRGDNVQQTSPLDNSQKPTPFQRKNNLHKTTRKESLTKHDDECQACAYQTNSSNKGDNRTINTKKKPHVCMYVCSICGYKTMYETMLEWHLKTHYVLTQVEATAIPCDVCLPRGETSKSEEVLDTSDSETCRLKFKVSYNEASGR